MNKFLLVTIFSLLLCGISSGADIVIPSGDTIQNYIDSAADGDVLILENGGIYETNQLEIGKSLTLKAEDGYTTRPVVYCNGTSGILFDGSGPTVKEIGIEFISGGARYLNRVDKNDSVHFIGMYDCVVRGFDRNVIQAKDNPSYLDTCIVEDCYVYGGGGGGYELIYIDDVSIEYLRLTNSSFVTFDESFIYCKNVQTIIVENCNIHGRTDNSNQYLFRLEGDTLESFFTLKNSIISNIKLDRIWDIDDDITDSIYNVFYHEIEHDSNMVKNTWSYEENFTKTDPKFSNGTAGALYLTAGSPALTASTTGSFIGASRWIELPSENTLMNLVVNGDASVLKPAFHNDTLNYTGEIPFAFGDTITVEALPAFADAVLTGTGKYAWDGSLELAVDVTVNGSKTFHLDLTRIPPNDDPTLKRIVLQDTVGTYYQLFPADQPGWNEFEVRFPVGMPVLYTIKTDKNFNGTDVSVEDSLDVSSGSGVLKVYSTAESGKSIIYTINARTIGTGTVTTLRSLTPYSATDTFELTSPPFNPGISDYFLEKIPSGTEMIYINAIPTDSYATVSGTDSVDVSSGSGIANITVTSEDGNNTQTYTIEITVAPTAVDDFTNNSINLYHNSRYEKLILSHAVDVKQVDIYNITGKLLIQKSYYNQNSMEISTNALKNGVYVVRLSDSNKILKTTKFIK